MTILTAFLVGVFATWACGYLIRQYVAWRDDGLTMSDEWDDADAMAEAKRAIEGREWMVYRREWDDEAAAEQAAERMRGLKA